MKFRLGPVGNPNDPFGDDKPVTVEVDEPRAQSSTPGSIQLVKDSFLPEVSRPDAAHPPFFDEAAPVSPEMRFTKISLAAVKADDHFAGLGDTGPSGHVEKVNLAPVECGYFDLPASEHHQEPEAGFTKSSAGDFAKFCRFTKVQETDDGDILVWGIATLEQPDLDGEICDYDAAKGAYQAWSLAAAQRTSAAGQQVSLGPIRYQHSPEPAGKAVKVTYNDDAKEIWLGSVPISDSIRRELQQGFLTGYSQGGTYAWRKCADCGKSLTLQQANNYCPACKKSVPVLFGLKRLSEVSYVDSPCTGKGFDYVKADGSSRFVSFTKRADPSPPDGVKILDTVRLFRGCYEHIVRIGGQKRTLIMKGEEIVLCV
jgi:hypothetical protein